MMDRDGRWDEFDAGKKQGRIDLIDELAATKVLVGIAEYEAMKELERAVRAVVNDIMGSEGIHIRDAIDNLNKARGK